MSDKGTRLSKEGLFQVQPREAREKSYDDRFDNAPLNSDKRQSESPHKGQAFDHRHRMPNGVSFYIEEETKTLMPWHDKRNLHKIL